MEGKQPNQTPEESHQYLMRSILSGLSDTPLTLKGGSALIFGYGLNRTSEDLDFDSGVKLNLQHKIEASIPNGYQINDLRAVKDTDTVTRLKLAYTGPSGEKGRLKLEVSYRDPEAASDINPDKPFRVASLNRLLHQKILAAHDGDHPRDKVRDLFDINFILSQKDEPLNRSVLARAKTFSADKPALLERYMPDYEVDNSVNARVELEDLVEQCFTNASTQSLDSRLSSLREKSANNEKTKGSTFRQTP